MSELPRQFGDDEDRALLERAAASPPSAPERVRAETWASVEARLLAPRRQRWWLLVLLVGGSGLAYAATRRPPPPAQVSARRASGAGAVQAARVAPQPSPTVAPAAQALDDLPMPHPPELSSSARRHRGPVRQVARSRAGVLAWPLPDDPPDRLPGEDEVLGPPAASPRLIIARQGQGEVSVVLAANRVVGTVRGTPVDLTVEPGVVSGKLGQRNVLLWIFGDRAEGEIGGIPVRIEVVETRSGLQLRDGFSVRSALGLAAVRLESDEGALSWIPDCRATRVGDGIYQGRCGRGGETRVVIPSAWRRLPALPRLMLLSFFLTERAPAVSRLFGD
jgi:hypothetical protein